MLIERFVVHRIGDENFSGMEAGIDFSEGENRAITIRAGCNNIFAERLAAQCIA